jgi:CHAD domain-containing protein
MGAGKPRKGKRPSVALEREAKLGASPELVLPEFTAVLPEVTVRPVESLVLDAVYYDTADLRLLRRGASLRRRSGEGATRWTLKMPSGDNASGGDNDGDGALVRREFDHASRSRQVPARLRSLITAYVRSAALEPVAHLRTTRRRLDIEAIGGEAAELADDAVEVLVDGEVVARFREVEVEAADSNSGALVAAIVDALRQSGASAHDPTPKAARAIGPAALLAPELSAHPSLDPGASLAEVARSSFIAAAHRIVEHDHVVRLDDGVEGVHQARVGTRRFRSHLRLFRSILDTSVSEPLRDELKWWGGELGAVRDLDVLIERLEARVGDLEAPDDIDAGRDLVARLRRQRDTQLGALHSVMDSDRYVGLLDDVVAFASDPPFVDQTDAPAVNHLIGWVGKHLRRLRREVASLPEQPTDAQLHEIRIEAKRVRYACEVATSVIPAAEPLARALADLQDELGDLQDTVVARAWLTEASGSVPRRQAFVAGQIAAAERAAADARRAGWRMVWERIDNKKLRRWLA